MHSGLMRTDSRYEPPTYPQLPGVAPASVVSLPRVQPREGLGLLDYWHILLKRKWTILACVVIAGTVSAIVSFRMTPQYRAVGKIAINREINDQLGFKDLGGTAEDDYDYMVPLETQVRILQSDALALAVINDVHLDRNPVFTGSKDTHPQTADALRPTSGDSERQSQLIGAFRGGLSVQIVPRTRIVELAFLSPDPKLSAQVVNSLAHQYLEQNFKPDSTPPCKPPNGCRLS